MFRTLAGIDTADTGYNHILLRPMPPAPASNPDNTPIHWVKARYDSVNGRIESVWRLENGVFHYDVTVPPNTTASVFLPTTAGEGVTESGRPAEGQDGIEIRSTQGQRIVLDVGPGSYSFACKFVGT